MFLSLVNYVSAFPKFKVLPSAAAPVIFDVLCFFIFSAGSRSPPRMADSGSRKSTAREKYYAIPKTHTGALGRFESARVRSRICR